MVQQFRFHELISQQHRHKWTKMCAPTYFNNTVSRLNTQKHFQFLSAFACCGESVLCSMALRRQNDTAPTSLPCRILESTHLQEVSSRQSERVAHSLSWRLVWGSYWFFHSESSCPSLAPALLPREDLQRLATAEFGCSRKGSVIPIWSTVKRMWGDWDSTLSTWVLAPPPPSPSFFMSSYCSADVRTVAGAKHQDSHSLLVWTAHRWTAV